MFSAKELKLSEHGNGRLFFMIGLPRSGKSTVLNSLAKELDAVVLNGDSFRLAIYDHDYIQSAESIVFSHIDVAARALRLNGQNIIIDETNSTASKRKHWRDLGGSAIYVNTTPEECIKRCHEEYTNLIDAIKRIGKNLERFDPMDPDEKVVRIYDSAGKMVVDKIPSNEKVS
jgi:predicted kinase